MTYHHRSSLGPVDLAFTDRYGGVGAAPTDELDLALGDAQDANWRRVMADFAPGDELCDLEQVHGAEVVIAGPRTQCADAVVTDRPGQVLAVRAADCVPILLADPDQHLVGAVHAGRRGLAGGVVPAAVARLGDLGATRLHAWIGPHVCGRCYEVPAMMRDEVAAVVPLAASTTRHGTPGLDLGAGVRAQLEAEGVQVHNVSVCTLESPDLFSYRRDGAAAGRHAALIRLRP